MLFRSEPQSLVCNVGYGGMLFYARRNDDAVGQLRKTIELDDSFFLAHAVLAVVFQVTGKWADSVQERARSAELNGSEQDAAGMRDSFEKRGWIGFARYMTGEGRPVRTSSYDDARFYAELGEKDKAFAALNKSFEERHVYLAGIKVDPLLDPLRDDPRFAELLRKVTFPE